MNAMEWKRRKRQVVLVSGISKTDLAFSMGGNIVTSAEVGFALEIMILV
jgi:hypothetical protein